MKKSNTTRGRGTPGPRLHGPYISLQHVKDQEFLKKLHNPVEPAAPMPGPNGAKPTKSRTPAIKSRKHAMEISPMQMRDKERPRKDLLKGTKIVRIPIPSDKIKIPEPATKATISGHSTTTPGNDWDYALSPASPLPAGLAQGVRCM